MKQEKLYVPFGDRATIEQLIKAAERNAERDKIDNKSGFAFPGQTSTSDLLRTAISAIGSGLSQSAPS